MLELVTTSQFKKDLKRLQKRGMNLKSLSSVLNSLCREDELEPRHRDHALVGRYRAASLHFRDLRQPRSTLFSLVMLIFSK